MLQEQRPPNDRRIDDKSTHPAHLPPCQAALRTRAGVVVHLSQKYSLTQKSFDRGSTSSPLSLSLLLFQLS